MLSKRENDPFPASTLQSASIEALKAFNRWCALCESFLPLSAEGTFWRFSRASEPGEPVQGWKIHISATVVEACDLFERVAPFLASRKLRFKAPGSLAQLIEINCGLAYGYQQVGKFITVYPASEEESVELAAELHKLTSEFIPVSVPFDEQYLPCSSVFYRYGAYHERRFTDNRGYILPAVEGPTGELLHDDITKAVPEWLTDPFLQNEAENDPMAFSESTPLTTTYRIFRGITQRGKGGTYHAVDLSGNEPRICIVKQGRRHGETFWNGQDGYHLVTHEHNVLTALEKVYDGVPRVYSSFELQENFFLALEFIDGTSLYDLIRSRQRRLPINQLIEYAAAIIGIIEKISEAGWMWNDCRPENILIDKKGVMRPIDFENAYRVGETAPFAWKSHNFAVNEEGRKSSANSDIYSFAAVTYFLLTGRYYDAGSPVRIEKLRRDVPVEFIGLVHDVLGGKVLKIHTIRARLKKIAGNV